MSCPCHGRVETYTQGSDTQTLAYDPASRIESLTDTGNSWAFSYDNLDRLKTADKADTSLSWDYDPTGNRIYENLNGTQTDYTTNPLSNKLSQLGASTRLYDDAGNMQDDGSISSTYSGRNRLVSTQGALAPTLYQYNAFGERVYKQGQTTTLFAYDEQGHLLGEYDSSGNVIAETIWLYDTPIATIRPDTESHNGLTAGNVKIFFIHPDHLDTPRTIVDASNLAIWQWHSDPFGTTPANEDIDNDGNNFVSNLRFPGQYFDIETNTHYNYFRDYEPQTGRYVQSDPIGLKGDINTYSYVGSEPNNFIDRSGESRSYGGKINNVGNRKKPKCKNCNKRKNRFDYTGLKNVYEIYNLRTGMIHKVGVGSGSKLSRCKSQLSKIRISTGDPAWGCRLVGYVCGTMNAELLEGSRQLDLRMRGHSLPGNQPRQNPR